MTRFFADLHLRANLKDPQVINRLINKAATLGYRVISIPFIFEMPQKEVDAIKEACNHAGIDFVSRVDLHPRTPDDLTHSLRKLRRKYEVIGVICENKEVSRQAAKDRRVDLLNFSSFDYHNRFFDRSEAELASNSLAALEIDVKPLLVLEGPARIRFLMSLRREITIAKEFRVPVIISSGVGEERFMRMPRDMASLSFLFGLDEANALEAISSLPLKIVKRNREKLRCDFIAPGIRVVKEGKDC